MSHLLSVTDLSKAFSATPLFRTISFSIEAGDRMGMVGPNGSGKSTLLRILAQQEHADGGSVVMRRGLRVSYLPQRDEFEDGASVDQVLMSHTDPTLSDAERHRLVGNITNRCGLPSGEVLIETLSGGWRKRVALASRLLEDPDLLLLDEPTNHLDLGTILWLERLLASAQFAYVVVSHDRTFLENTTARIVEISKRYPNGFLLVDGSYSRYLELREQTLEQLHRQEAALSNTVKREVEWLRRGPRARTTKASARIRQAEQYISELADSKSRSRASTRSEIAFTSTGRQSKELIVLKAVSKGFGEKAVVQNLSLAIRKGTKLGIVGPNGAGKSTVLHLLSRSLTPDSGEIAIAPDLRIATFDQQRSALSEPVSLRRFLAPEGEQVFFQGRSLHVASYAKRFLFEHDQLGAMVSGLSGGEQARLLVARLMLQPADVLLLDEPTNDLDIETLQVLEENLIEFDGAVVLITHDRLMCESVCNTFLAIDGVATELYATFDQWLSDREEQLLSSAQRPIVPSASPKPTVTPMRVDQGLTDKERRELSNLPKSIEKAEIDVTKIEEELAQKLAAGVPQPELSKLYALLAEASKRVQLLYTRWEELEART